MTLDWTPAVPAVLNDETQQEVTPRVAAENETLDGIFTRFERYVAPKSNQIRSTVVFNRRSQLPTERFDDFVTDLKRIIRECGFDDIEERMIRDAIVLRSYQARVREKCLDKGDELTLAMAISYGQSNEASIDSLKVIANEKSESVHKTCVWC